MSEYFWKLPSKRLYPDYYKTIKNPISLLQIRTKIKVNNKNKNYLIFYNLFLFNLYTIIYKICFNNLIFIER